MTYTTELLENESGIQYQGVKDKSGSTGTYPITGLMTGIFKRGRFDKPMTITNENIRAQLGYDPKNSYYVAVQDVLSSGVPSVQVLRIMGSDINGSFEKIDVSKLDFPVAGGIVAFKVPSENYRFSINVNGEDISGSLSEIILSLYENYKIHTSYSMGSDIIFTISDNSERIFEVAIKGVQQATDNLYFYDSNSYCDILNHNSDLFTFSLRRTRDYALIPLKDNSEEIIKLDDSLKYLVYSKPTDLAPINNNINMTPWYFNSESSEIATRDTVVNYNYPSAKTVTFGEIMDNWKTETEFNYEFFYHKTLMATLATAMPIDAEWNSNISEFQVNENCWLDFSQESKNLFIIKKGYPLWLGEPS